MSDNMRYAQDIAKFLEETAEGLAGAAVMGALKGAMEATYQDSGNAAYHWYISAPGGAGGLRSTGLKDLRGFSPVGERGEIRGKGHREVMEDKVGPANAVGVRNMGEVGKAVFGAIRAGATKLRLGHPITDGVYASHAKLAMALNMANGRAEQAANAYMSKFKKYDNRVWSSAAARSVKRGL